MSTSSTNIGCLQAALDFLYGRLNYEHVPIPGYQTGVLKLDRMRALLERLGNPHRGTPVIHVAGTKGKGSTSAMLAAVLTAAGYRTGLYTSPHLERLEERFNIDGLPCTAEQLVALTAQIQPHVEAMDQTIGTRGPTFFEVVTAIAWLHFAAQRTQAIVLEVGLGGRLDSTNVCEPDLAIITSISFDHVRQLGSKLHQIAREKAGIIKPGIPVVSGVEGEEATAVIVETCTRLAAPLVQIGHDFAYTYLPAQPATTGAPSSRADLRWRTDATWQTLPAVELGLLGRQQAANAAVALAAVVQLRQQGWVIPDAAVRQGLAQVRWPARIEHLCSQPHIILDVAHNAASAEALAETLRDSFSVQRRWLLFGSSREKDVPGMLAALLPLFDGVWITQYTNNPRAMPPVEIAALAAELTDKPLVCCADPVQAWQAARQATAADDLLCITGSVFLAAQLRAQLLAECGHGSR